VNGQVTASGSFVRPDVVAEPLDALRAENGLLPDPELAMPPRHLVVSPFPPIFRNPAYPLPPKGPSVQRHRPAHPVVRFVAGGARAEAAVLARR